MAPKASKKRSPPSDPNGIFSGMVVFLVDNGVQRRRLQIWKQKLLQMGAIVEDETLSANVTHVFAVNSESLRQKFGPKLLQRFKGTVLAYQWLEETLRLGEKVSEESYTIQLGSCQNDPKNSSNENSIEPGDVKQSSDNQSHLHKKLKTSPTNSESFSPESKDKSLNDSVDVVPHIDYSSENRLYPRSPSSSTQVASDAQQSTVNAPDASLPYHPPDLNRNITEIFGKLINIYRALGDDRRSFSYYKAIPVIERLPYKIESVDQVKDLPAIGKSMQDHVSEKSSRKLFEPKVTSLSHKIFGEENISFYSTSGGLVHLYLAIEQIHEIITTGKLSKLEHFESDEKVRTISLFGEVWGIGPATALKLYEKGHRSLDDLKGDGTLTNSQKLGLKYFEDIRSRIPRDEVQEMERLLQKAAEDVLPGVSVVCGGSFRRGKATCGDMDIVITHPDGKSHVGFLPKYVNHLKDMNFLREDLVFSIHSEQGTDSGVDTYFGLCTYPGRELRHRIDLKVYPKDIYPFGLIAWTGNDVLNRRLRILAESKGFRLDDTGLFPATHGSGGKRVSGSTSLKFKSEKEVFDFLGFPWLEPHQRNL